MKKPMICSFDEIYTAFICRFPKGTYLAKYNGKPSYCFTVSDTDSARYYLDFVVDWLSVDWLLSYDVSQDGESIEIYSDSDSVTIEKAKPIDPAHVAPLYFSNEYETISVREMYLQYLYDREFSAYPPLYTFSMWLSEVSENCIEL